MAACSLKESFPTQPHANLWPLSIWTQILLSLTHPVTFSLITKQTLIDSDNDTELDGGKKSSPAALSERQWTVQDVNICPLTCVFCRRSASCVCDCLSANLSLQFCHLTPSACTLTMRAV